MWCFSAFTFPPLCKLTVLDFIFTQTELPNLLCTSLALYVVRGVNSGGTGVFIIPWMQHRQDHSVSGCSQHSQLPAVNLQQSCGSRDCRCPGESRGSSSFHPLVLSWPQGFREQLESYKLLCLWAKQQVRHTGEALRHFNWIHSGQLRLNWVFKMIYLTRIISLRKRTGHEKKQKGEFI